VLYGAMIIFILIFALVICVHFLTRRSIPEKEPTRLLEMIGSDSRIESISIKGTYIVDNLGNINEKVISTITDKGEINKFFSVLSEYEFKYMDTAKMPQVKMSKDIGTLGRLEFSFNVNNIKYKALDASLGYELHSGYVSTGVTKQLKGKGYKTVYYGISIDDNLINYLETNYSK
jgi:hypothetical protein